MNFFGARKYICLLKKFGSILPLKTFRFRFRESKVIKKLVSTSGIKFSKARIAYVQTIFMKFQKNLKCYKKCGKTRVIWIKITPFASLHLNLPPAKEESSAVLRRKEKKRSVDNRNKFRKVQPARFTVMTMGGVGFLL